MPEMDKAQIKAMLQRYAAGTATPEEQALVERWFYNRSAELPTMTEIDRDLAEVWEHIRPQAVVRKLWPRIAAAAAILIAIGTAAVFLMHQRNIQQIQQIVQNDIAPGHNQATLTLANGQKIVLTKGLKGQLASQGGTTITATNNDIAYNSIEENEQVSYNTLATARGEQSPYPLVLADGTKVWLNAESSITFPTTFTGRERIVKVTGEAYFDVKHNPNQPFRVQVKDQVVEDIGTSFNINAYTDEPVTKTTLITGSIRTADKILKPGQAAIVSASGVKVVTANPDEVTAWMSGQFRFDDEPLDELLRKAARWYDIKVVYDQEGYKQETYAGVTTRYASVSQLLSKLEKAGDLKFRLEGHTVKVTAK